MKLQQIKANPKNPRVLRDDKFKKLVKSIQDFPKMMELRPIVTDADGVILGGNMRYRALQAIYGSNGDIPDSWVVKADDLTDEQKREFVIKDNSAFGEWDWDALANDWDAEELAEWGLDVPSFSDEEGGGMQKEEARPFDKSLCLIAYNPNDHQAVMEALKPISDFCEITTQMI
jgi:ParB-like chromosome segregation protein Spo0J